MADPTTQHRNHLRTLTFAQRVTLSHYGARIVTLTPVYGDAVASVILTLSTGWTVTLGHGGGVLAESRA